MRLPAKIFFCVIAVFGVVFLISGYFLLSHSFRNCIEREIEFALRQYQYDRFLVQSALITDADLLRENGFSHPDVKEILEKITEDVREPVCFFNESGENLYDETGEAGEIDLAGLSADSYWYQVLQRGNGSFILCGSRIAQDRICLYFVTRTDITASVAQQNVLQAYFRRCFCAAMGAIVLLTFGLSQFLTAPLKRLTKSADRIAAGDYHERIQVRGNDELGELAQSFNRMAQAVEEAISELSAEAAKKEDFAANFAHEIKTPLTSVIGYADRIYQKDLPGEEVKKAAWYIWNEGMRLSALSHKLMDLTNLSRQEFAGLIVPAEDFLYDLAEEVREILAGQGVGLRCTAEEADICVDCDLMKTLFLNLIDNAVKAECGEIDISGKRAAGAYCIRVADNGRGIPQQELSRITEAFYMVDKARSRKQHGAGLGLALVQRITELHGGTLRIQSEEGAGTSVFVTLPTAKGGGEDA